MTKDGHKRVIVNLNLTNYFLTLILLGNSYLVRYFFSLFFMPFELSPMVNEVKKTEFVGHMQRENQLERRNLS